MYRLQERVELKRTNGEWVKSTISRIDESNGDITLSFNDSDGSVKSKTIPLSACPSLVRRLATVETAPLNPVQQDLTVLKWKPGNEVEILRSNGTWSLGFVTEVDETTKEYVLRFQGEEGSKRIPFHDSNAHIRAKGKQVGTKPKVAAESKSTEIRPPSPNSSNSSPTSSTIVKSASISRQDGTLTTPDTRTSTFNSSTTQTHINSTPRQVTLLHLHPHPLTWGISNSVDSLWICDLCQVKFRAQHLSWSCQGCNYDICTACINDTEINKNIVPSVQRIPTPTKTRRNSYDNHVADPGNYPQQYGAPSQLYGYPDPYVQSQNLPPNPYNNQPVPNISPRPQYDETKPAKKPSKGIAHWAAKRLGLVRSKSPSSDPAKNPVENGERQSSSRTRTLSQPPRSPSPNSFTQHQQNYRSTSNPRARPPSSSWL